MERRASLTASSYCARALSREAVSPFTRWHTAAKFQGPGQVQINQRWREDRIASIGLGRGAMRRIGCKKLGRQQAMKFEAAWTGLNSGRRHGFVIGPIEVPHPRSDGESGSDHSDTNRERDARKTEAPHRVIYRDDQKA
jgi:hypothetical protein